MTQSKQNILSDAKYKELCDWFRKFRAVIVAYSGGVDSSLLLQAATEALGPERVVGVTSCSESLSEEALIIAQEVARAQGFRHEIIEYSDLELESYAANSVNRCYYCKKELYQRLAAIAKERGANVVVEGSNRDDEDDYRPGMQAAREKGVRSPLKELGIRKAQIREWAKRLGLPNWDLPSDPCLSSRFPYGRRITREGLGQVEACERFLRENGFSQVRVRHCGDTARIELPTDEMPRVFLERGLREFIIENIKGAGFIYVTIDLRGFRSGSLNEALGRETDSGE
ncbi:ATP-dependent sacrificial sulfur transferase LarE [Candidatus Sumerlaeota bacterium]|nr:ATP-dependent sacrificial sulfur transferase LarE [Candidatus Sumerlaeota bacterium]